MAGAWGVPTVLVPRDRAVLDSRDIFRVQCLNYNKHLISEQPQLDVACKVFLELVLKIIFLSFYFFVFLSNSK